MTRTSRDVGSRVFSVLELEVWPVRVTAAFWRLLSLEGVWVRGVEFLAAPFTFAVAGQVDAPGETDLPCDPRNNLGGDGRWVLEEPAEVAHGA